MMRVDWPLAARAAARPSDPVRMRAGRSRLAVAKADFFLDEQRRLTDEERSLMSSMLKRLVAEITDELLASVPALIAARAEPYRAQVQERLAAAGLFDRDELIALLLRRADVQRLSGQAAHGANTIPAKLVGDEDATVAEAAMALTIARGQRVDRFGRLGITLDDVAADDAVALVYAIAAGLKVPLEADADIPFADGARDLLSRYDEGRRIDAVLQSLARALDHAGRANDEMVRRAAEDHDAGLLVALLARRGGIDYQDAWQMFVAGDVPMLARIAQCYRQTAALIFASFDARLGQQSADALIDAFDGLAEVQVDQYRSWLRLDPHYRRAQERLEQPDG